MYAEDSNVTDDAKMHAIQKCKPPFLLLHVEGSNLRKARFTFERVQDMHRNERAVKRIAKTAYDICGYGKRKPPSATASPAKRKSTKGSESDDDSPLKRSMSFEQLINVTPKSSGKVGRHSIFASDSIHIKMNGTRF